jgi:hypothetical protein
MASVLSVGAQSDFRRTGECLVGETDIVNDIKLQLFGEFPRVRLFRNNNGRLRDIHGNYVTYGLGVGTSDLVGFQTVDITPAMLGQRVAVFVAIEVKRPRARTEPKRLQQQLDFLALVQTHGGRAGLATSFADARNILTQVK